MYDEDDTPQFNKDHKSTACFGCKEEFSKYMDGIQGDTNGAPLETDGGNILVQRRKDLAHKEILKKTIVKKKYGLKQLLASKRQLFLYKDGFIAYTASLNQTQIKQDIDPREIIQIMRSKSTLTVVADRSDANLAQGLGERDTLVLNNNTKQQGSINYSFKFSTIDEAKDWYKLISSFI